MEEKKKGNRMMSFKGWMADNGVKQKEIAELLGISITATNAKVNQRQDFTLEQIKKICAHYGISADIFLVEKLQKCN